MGLHKLTAGDGYTYLTRQVAAHDSTEKGHASLGDYYSDRGESPGHWLGAGLDGLSMAVGEPVTEPQMKSLFGLGRHPNADALSLTVVAAGGATTQAGAAGALGRPFNVYDGASSFQMQVARAFTAHNLERGLAWHTPIPAEDRASIRTALATRMFNEEHDRAPQDARELAGFVATASRQATTAVAGFDLTFSPVKSVSALWALAPRGVATQIRDAHDAAVADTIGWLEREAVFTRVGRGGTRQVSVRGVIAASFTHRDTRAGDPDLHTHVAISNKVQTLLEPGAGAGKTGGGAADDRGGGRWLALDGRVLYKANVAASERYNTRLEAELTARLGIRFVERSDTGDKRPVREVAGINPLLARWWSTRRRDIEVRRSELAAGFQSQHGRPPTAVEAIALAQQATLETRDAKHEPRSEADQRTAWRTQAERVLGGPAEVDAMLDATLGHSPTSPSTSPPLSSAIGRDWVAAVGATVVATVESSRATWQVWHLRAEAERQARAAGIGLSDLDSAVDQVVEAALGDSILLGGRDPISEPVQLRRPNGESVYEVHGSARYTSARVLAAEQQLVATAATSGGRAISDVRVAIAIAEEAADGIVLNDPQAAMVSDLATSGARLQLAVAPAGTGKTTAMRVLARAWSDAGGYVLGLAPSAQAAHELGNVLDGHTDTLAKLTWTLTHTHPQNRSIGDPGAVRPGWVDRIGPRTLVIIDEAGQAATTELATAVAHITSQGGSVRLIGDDQQLASVAAGGVLADIAHTMGAATLTEVHRFHDPAEAAATLAVREGDTSALGFYADNARIHVGDIGSATDQAYDAWTADRRQGLDSVLLAPTRDLVTRLNTRARTDRLAHPAGNPGSQAPAVRLVDGTHASAGDSIITRRNDRYLSISGNRGCDWVRNGDRWVVRTVHPDGSLTARREGTGPRTRSGVSRARVVRLPAGYVVDHVQLGYATTVHAAQGMTTDTAHTVVTGDETRQLLYVALSRGRAANHLYLTTASDGDPHTVIRPETLTPPTALDTLAGILHRDGAQQSATSTQRHLDDPATQLHQAVARYADALAFAAEQAIGTDTLTALDQQLETLWPGLTTEPAYPTLRAHLALIAAAGTDPMTALLAAENARQVGRLHAAHDRAAVLDSRLTTSPASPASGPPTSSGRSSGPDRPLPWLPAVPTLLAGHPDWGAYLEARAARVIALADRVHHDATSWTPTQTPDWARHLTSPDAAQLRGDIAVWRAAHAVPDDDARTTGPRQASAAGTVHQRHLAHQVRAATGVSAAPGTIRFPVADLPDRVRLDAHAGRLRGHLADLERAGIPVIPLLDQALALPRPLPDEYPADALWWRIVRHLGPAALRASSKQQHTTSGLRPEWTPTLIEHLGVTATQRVMADPAWPALVAAVHARPAEWTAGQLIESALQGSTSLATLSVADLCDALVWRVATMTDIPDDPPETSASGESEDRDQLDDLPRCSRKLSDPFGVDTAPEVGRHTSPRTPTGSTDSRPSVTAGPSAVQPTGTSRTRIIDLNRAALAYYEDMFPRSWAPHYLLDRIGTDLSDQPHLRVGYAPPGPTSLTRHLTTTGATTQELVDAGLARRTEHGHLIDMFRDRLIFPIHQDRDPVGFIARRNPTKDPHDSQVSPYSTDRPGSTRAGHRQLSAGPKYLNTPATPAFTKGAQSYGLTEGADALAQGAVPVLVEGPLDAIAVTTAARGAAVGIAPLGTALTTRQTEQLRPFFRDDPARIAVATDPDAAGWLAARRAFWLLTQHGADPRHVRLPHGLDPAEYLHKQGPHGLEAARRASVPLAHTLIDDLVTDSRDDPRSPAIRLRLVKQAGQIIGALPPPNWAEHIDRVTDELDLPAGMLHLEVADAGHAWITDPPAAAAQRLTELSEQQRRTRTNARPHEQWRRQLESTFPSIATSPDWPNLLTTLNHANAHGHNVAALLTRHIAAPFSEQTSVATQLRLRLLGHLEPPPWLTTAYPESDGPGPNVPTSRPMHPAPPSSPRGMAR